MKQFMWNKSEWWKCCIANAVLIKREEWEGSNLNIWWMRRRSALDKGKTAFAAPLVLGQRNTANFVHLGFFILGILTGFAIILSWLFSLWMHQCGLARFQSAHLSQFLTNYKARWLTKRGHQNPTGRNTALFPRIFGIRTSAPASNKGVIIRVSI